MDFSPELRERVANGEITLTIRLWQRARAKVGGRYSSTGVDGAVVVDSIELLPFSALADEDIKLTGETDREAMRQRAAHAGPITDDTVVYRIEFHLE